MKTIHKIRNQKGQGLIEGVCGLVTVLSVFVLLTAFGVNMYAISSDAAKVQIVANETAKRINDLYFWYGAKRPLFQRLKNHDGSGTGNLSGPAIGGGTHKISESQKNAVTYAQQLCKNLGLPSEGLDVRFSDPVVKGEFEYTKVVVSGIQRKVPFNIKGVFPSSMKLSAVGVAVQATSPPPAFIRLGYNLISGDTVNPSDTSNVTQVAILPSYGFQTDAPEGAANLNGETNNKFIGSQPDPFYCGWNGINADTKILPDGTRRSALYGTPPMQKNSLGGHTWYFDVTPREIQDPNNVAQ